MKPQCTAAPSNADCVQKATVESKSPALGMRRWEKEHCPRESGRPHLSADPRGLEADFAAAWLMVNSHEAEQKPFSTFKEIRNAFFTCGGAENCE